MIIKVTRCKEHQIIVTRKICEKYCEMYDDCKTYNALPKRKKITAPNKEVMA